MWKNEGKKNKYKMKYIKRGKINAKRKENSRIK